MIGTLVFILQYIHTHLEATMGLIQEFREFAVKGNMIDMAVGIIIGGAFGKIVNSLVADIMMPPLGLLMGQKDFSQYAVTLWQGSNGSPAPVMLRYGSFINTFVDFMIVAIGVFFLVKVINRLRRQREQAPTPPAPTEQERLLAEIRDLLKTRQTPPASQPG
jgi:large conductance mechanosensitive channel